MSSPWSWRAGLRCTELPHDYSTTYVTGRSRAWVKSDPIPTGRSLYAGHCLLGCMDKDGSAPLPVINFHAINEVVRRIYQPHLRQRCQSEALSELSKFIGRGRTLQRISRAVPRDDNRGLTSNLSRRVKPSILCLLKLFSRAQPGYVGTTAVRLALDGSGTVTLPNIIWDYTQPY
jgi:hypothetical protein